MGHFIKAPHMANISHPRRWVWYFVVSGLL